VEDNLEVSRKGQKPGIEIEADDNLAIISTDFRDNVLRIY
jgi:hypothetical protein